MLHGEVSWKVICEVVGVTSGVGRTYWTYHLLEHAWIRVLLSHMISKPRLREPHLTTEGTREGSGLLCTVILTTKEEIYGNKVREEVGDTLASSPGPFEGRRRKGLVHTDSACANGHCNLLVFYTVAPTSHVVLA